MFAPKTIEHLFPLLLCKVKPHRKYRMLFPPGKIAVCTPEVAR